MKQKTRDLINARLFPNMTHDRRWHLVNQFKIGCAIGFLITAVFNMFGASHGLLSDYGIFADLAFNTIAMGVLVVLIEMGKTSHWDSPAARETERLRALLRETEARRGY